MVREVSELIADFGKLYNGGRALSGIHFDRHIYEPLLLDNKRGKVKISPPGLQESEKRFVEDLKQVCSKELHKLPDGAELFLLRNLTRGKGVGFFEANWFYPDFILWIKTGDTQRIVFVEPHGMVHANAYGRDEKVRLHERLPDLAREIAERSAKKDVQLDSFIVSATPYDELCPMYGNGDWTREDFAAKHILFPEHNSGYDYIAKILEPPLSNAG